LGVDIEYTFDGFHGLIVLFEHELGCAEFLQGGEMLWEEFGRFLHGAKALPGFEILQIDIRQQAIKWGLHRIERNGTLEIGECGVEITALEVELSATGIGEGVFGVLPNDIGNGINGGIGAVFFDGSGVISGFSGTGEEQETQPKQEPCVCILIYHWKHIV
jgi:hypothetical protein